MPPSQPIKSQRGYPRFPAFGSTLSPVPLWCTLVRKIQNNCFDQFTTLLLLSTAVCQSSFFYDILDHNIFLKPFSCFFLASLKLNPLTKTEIPGVEKVTLSITVMWSLTFLNCTLYVMILGGSFNQFSVKCPK